MILSEPKTELTLTFGPPYPRSPLLTNKMLWMNQVSARLSTPASTFSNPDTPVVPSNPCNSGWNWFSPSSASQCLSVTTIVSLQRFTPTTRSVGLSGDLASRSKGKFLHRIHRSSLIDPQGSYSTTAHLVPIPALPYSAKRIFLACNDVTGCRHVHVFLRQWGLF